MVVLPVIVAAVGGFALGMLRRPLGAHLDDPVVILPGVAVGGVALQVGPGVLDVPAEGQVLGVSLALLCGFAVVNRHLIGMGVLAVGLALNMGVVLANGAMPVRASALVSSGAVEARELVDTDLGAGRRFEHVDDLVPVLGDAIPVRPFRAAMSFGDLIVLMGIGALTSDLTRYARRGSGRRRTKPADQVGASMAATTDVHDWGTAPNPAPSSGFQYSAHPDDDAPDTVIVLTDAATSSDPDLVAARNDK